MPHHVPRTALYAGSFDPVTNGHLDVMRQAMRLCDRLVCAIGVHPGKAPVFSPDERMTMLEEVAGPLVKETGAEFACITFSDLVISAAQREKATLLIRGLRDATDFDYEMHPNAPDHPMKGEPMLAERGVGEDPGCSRVLCTNHLRQAGDCEKNGAKGLHFFLFSRSLRA